MSTEEGTVRESVVEGPNGSDILSGGVGDDGGEGLGSEAVGLGVVETVEVEELEQDHHVALGLGLWEGLVSVRCEGKGIGGTQTHLSLGNRGGDFSSLLPLLDGLDSTETRLVLGFFNLR